MDENGKILTDWLQRYADMVDVDIEQSEDETDTDEDDPATDEPVDPLMVTPDTKGLSSGLSSSNRSHILVEVQAMTWLQLYPDMVDMDIGQSEDETDTDEDDPATDEPVDPIIVAPDTMGLSSGLSSINRSHILAKVHKGTSIFHNAIRWNHRRIIDLLLTLPLDEIIDLLMIQDKSDHYPSATALQYAAEYNRHEILTDILGCFRAAGKSPLPLLLRTNNIKWTAVHQAAAGKRWQVLESMLNSLETPEEKDQLLTMRDIMKMTVLHHAARSGAQTLEVIMKQMSAGQHYQVMKMKDIFQQSAVHIAVHFQNTDMVRTLMNPLTPQQKIELLKMTDKDGFTPQAYAIIGMHQRSAKVEEFTKLNELLGEQMTTAYIEIAKTEAKDALKILRFVEPLNSKQIAELYPSSQQYMIPRNQWKVKQHAIILYRESGRVGAREEADSISEPMKQAGCDVAIGKWSTVSELKLLMVEELSSRCGTSSLLILCLMSHGSEGCVEGIDGPTSINSLLKVITPAILPHHIPLVMMIQACQSSSDRYSTGHNRLMDPATVAQGACAALSQRHTITSEERRVDLRREHTILIQTSLSGQVSYRGEYLKAMGNQIRQADGILTINDMHERAVYEMERRYGPGGTPKVTSTLKRSLVLPGTQ